MNSWWEIACDQCGATLAYTPDTMPRGVTYCPTCKSLFQDREEEEAAEARALASADTGGRD